MRRALLTGCGTAICTLAGCIGAAEPLPRNWLSDSADRVWYPGLPEDAVVLVALPVPDGSWTLWRGTGREERTNAILRFVTSPSDPTPLPRGAVSCAQEALVEQVQAALDAGHLEAIFLGAEAGTLRDTVAGLAIPKGVRLLPDPPIEDAGERSLPCHTSARRQSVIGASWRSLPRSTGR
jgi:hypothetical protein